MPLPEDRGTGLGKPLKLINHPVRDRIPIVVAAIGPKNVAMTAELAEGWEPIFYVPEQAKNVWGAALAAGTAKRDPSLPPLDVVVGAPLAMGARDQNFYRNLARRYGYEAEAQRIQDLYLDGKKAEAAAAVPHDLLARTSLIGQEGHIAERLAALRETGVTTINVTPLAATHAERVRLIERVKELASGA